jgi:hypothetical protein
VLEPAGHLAPLELPDAYVDAIRLEGEAASFLTGNGGCEAATA